MDDLGQATGCAHQDLPYLQELGRDYHDRRCIGHIRAVEAQDHDWSGVTGADSLPRSVSSVLDWKPTQSVKTGVQNADIVGPLTAHEDIPDPSGRIHSDRADTLRAGHACGDTLDLMKIWCISSHQNRQSNPGSPSLQKPLL